MENNFGPLSASSATPRLQEVRQMNQIDQAHCQSCGSTSPEDVNGLRETDGYTRCCNERVVGGDRDLYGRPYSCKDSNDCYHDRQSRSARPHAG